MANYRINLSNSKTVSSLWDYFPIPQPPQFHYTKIKRAKAMADGRIRLTRADCLVDPSEIDYGLGLLSDAIDSGGTFSGIPSLIKQGLKHCYVLSLSTDPCNEYLIKTYAGSCGAKVKFENAYFTLMAARNSPPVGLGDPVDDLFTFYQGMVIYERDLQLEIVTKLEHALPEAFDDETHTVDRSHLLDTLIVMPSLLFKKACYAKEEETRFIAVAKDGVSDSVERSFVKKDGSISYYIELMLYGSFKPVIDTVYGG